MISSDIKKADILMSAFSIGMMLLFFTSALFH